MMTSMKAPDGFNPEYDVEALASANRQTQANITAIRTAMQAEAEAVRALQIQISLMKKQREIDLDRLKQLQDLMAEKQSAVQEFQNGIDRLQTQITQNQSYIEYKSWLLSRSTEQPSTS
jgi:hypothetical protein